MRQGLLAFLVLALVAGCSAPAPVQAPAPDEEAPAIAEGPAPGVVPAPPEPAGPAVHRNGQELVVTGIGRATATTWSPSGRRAVIQAGGGAYLLEDDPLTVRLLPGFTTKEAVAFWSEEEVLWQGEGSLKLRDLVSGQDRLQHSFGASVIHLVRPGDSHYVALRPTESISLGYQMGEVVTGRIGGQEERTLIASGYVVGRLRTGKFLAVASEKEGGPLWAISPAGEMEPLSVGAAHFVQLSPGGEWALWLTDAEERAVDPEQFYDPPLTDLWVSDGLEAPRRIPLGGSYSVRAAFSPDGRRIALALNEGFLTAQDVRPGQLAVWEGGSDPVPGPVRGLGWAWFLAGGWVLVQGAGVGEYGRPGATLLDRPGGSAGTGQGLQAAPPWLGAGRSRSSDLALPYPDLARAGALGLLE